MNVGFYFAILLLFKPIPISSKLENMTLLPSRQKWYFHYIDCHLWSSLPKKLKVLKHYLCSKGIEIMEWKYLYLQIMQSFHERCLVFVGVL